MLLACRPGKRIAGRKTKKITGHEGRVKQLDRNYCKTAERVEHWLIDSSIKKAIGIPQQHLDHSPSHSRPDFHLVA